MKRIFTVTVLAALVALTGGYIGGGRPVTQTSATVHADEGAHVRLLQSRENTDHSYRHAPASNRPSS